MTFTHSIRGGLALGATALTLSVGLAACGSDSDSSSEGGGEKKSTIGVLYVGPHTDFGYNQAVYEGIQDLKKEMPDVEVLEAENVPETS
ncbi:MAG: hypothetical protein JHD16_09320, partial [Solirubrobacteraceae bacterium]|nr:hypothetical protein [Solirubrobacteraceae bacterium]